MLITVGDFVDRVEHGLPDLVADLQDVTGRSGDEEKKAWEESFAAILPVLKDLNQPDLQIYFSENGPMSLEYRLPASFSFADLVLLGNHNNQPAAVIVELKNWLTRSDSPGQVEGLMVRQGQVSLHPSDQVCGYTNYCQQFHSAVQDHSAKVHGCVWFTRDSFISSYRNVPNGKLTEKFPCFAVQDPAQRAGLVAYFRDRLTEPNPDFAAAFEAGRYSQNRNFCQNIGEQILRPESTPFVLLDGQRRAFNRCWEFIQNNVLRSDPPRRCSIIIEGPPGSGKSVIAARLWASLVQDSRLPKGNVVITTTSQSQNSSWAHLFTTASGKKAAAGAIKKANAYMPAISKELNGIEKKYPGSLRGMDDWRENIALLRNVGKNFRMQDQEMLISIVDEAHALINPEKSSGRGQFGFDPRLGPQAWHIIRSSVVTIFLLDPQQSFRERENTSVADIKFWSLELGAEIPDSISLADSQFRCNGSKEYVDWIDQLLKGASSPTLRKLAQSWRAPQRPLGAQPIGAAAAEPPGSGTGHSGQFEFDVFESPQELEDALRFKAESRVNVRLLASYAREWVTGKAASPHNLPNPMKDFQIPYSENGRSRIWYKVWNYAPGGDYSYFNQGAPGMPIAQDPLCEVGCPYAVRGFDFDYVGILWLSDLVWRDDHWELQPDHVFETGLSRILGRVKKNPDPKSQDYEQLLAKIAQGYRILLTRAIRGVYFWVEDAETRDHLVNCSW